MDDWTIPTWDEKCDECVDIDERIVEDKALRRLVKNEQVTGIIARRLNDLCRIPNKGEEYLISTEKSFNAYACIKSLLEGGGDRRVIYCHLSNQSADGSSVDRACG